MTDEIEQLLRNLHLKKIAAIVDDELAADRFDPPPPQCAHSD